jgi:hypothetical protein
VLLDLGLDLKEFTAASSWALGPLLSGVIGQLEEDFRLGLERLREASQFPPHFGFQLG